MIRETSHLTEGETEPRKGNQLVLDHPAKTTIPEILMSNTKGLNCVEFQTLHMLHLVSLVRKICAHNSYTLFVF